MHGHLIQNAKLYLEGKVVTHFLAKKGNFVTQSSFLDERCTTKYWLCSSGHFDSNEFLLEQQKNKNKEFVE